ncbi:MAG TPA: MIP/aquaporin family protein [Candidatus Limnocylindrales bacterium]
MRDSWIGKYIGEAIGVYLIVLFGCGLLFSAILFGVIGDFFSAGMGWGLAVAIAVYAAASMSGAHFNPAVTLGLAVTGRFPWNQVVQYWVAQIVGGFLGAVSLLALFGDAFGAFATKNNLVIGQAGSEKLAMMLIPVSPHPWVIGINQAAYDAVPIWRGFLAEALCTAILMAFILALLEKRSVNGPTSWFFPVGLVFLVCMIVIIDGPLTMTSLNPARDLGPRILALLMGFGSVAFPGVRDGGSLLVTAGAPLVGGVVGALFFDYVMKPFFPPEHVEAPAPAALAGATPAGVHPR